MPIKYTQPHGEWGNDAADWQGSDEALRDAIHEQINNKHHGDAFDWAEDFVLTEAEVQELAAPCWAYENLLPQGHIVVLCAPPNGGKTTIMLFVSAELAAVGYEVIYINADVSGSDAKEMHLYAQEHGFRMLFPDMKVGRNVQQIMDKLRQMSESDTGLSEYVLVIDTLKKITDLLDKKLQKELYALLRRLTGRGLTICLNSHTNKYNGPDGKPVFEGTNEVRSESDDLLYLVAEEIDGELIVSTLPDKKRAGFKPITFCIDAERNVSRRDQYVDVLTVGQQRRQYEEDMDRIAQIEEVLSSGPKNQAEVVDALKGRVNHKTVRRVLRAYGRPDSYRWHWETSKAIARNVLRYSLRRQLAPEEPARAADSVH